MNLPVRDYADGHPAELCYELKHVSSYQASDGQYVAVCSNLVVGNDVFTIRSGSMPTRIGARRALWRQLLRAGWRQELFV